MSNFEKFTAFMFSLNVLIGFIGFGYFLNYLFGMWAAWSITPTIYIPLVLIGLKPATKEFPQRY